MYDILCKNFLYAKIINFLYKIYKKLITENYLTKIYH